MSQYLFLSLRTNLELYSKFVQQEFISMIDRQLATKVSQLMAYYQVITITGPRQSGKTTLCREMFKDFDYVNLEDPIVREQTKEDPRTFFDMHTKRIIIDEIQNATDLFSFIQVLVDEDRSRKFILTGSSNFTLLSSITQSLAGRTAVLTLLPLSLSELDAAHNSVTTDTLILNGGYPAVWANALPRFDMYRNYYSTYVERDVRQLLNVKDIATFQKFIRLSAGRIGQLFNASSLAGETGTTTKTIGAWLNVLTASYIVYTLQPYFDNISKRLIKTPKLYFHDTGLACYLLGIRTEEQLQTHPLRGALFENMVINEAFKSRTNIGEDPNLFFYRDKSQTEVDLLTIDGIQMNAYEIKSGKSYQSEYFKGLNVLRSIFGDRIASSAVIYDGSDELHTPINGCYNIRNVAF